MEVRIIETKEIKELCIYDENGTEWTHDLLGSYNGLNYNYETEEYELSQDDFDFWNNYINNHVADEELIKDTAEELEMDPDEIWEIVNESVNDIEQEHDVVLSVIKSLTKEDHWLETLCKEYDTTVYQIAKTANADKSILYRVISNNAKIENISLSTAIALSEGLGIEVVEFVTDVYDRFKEVE